MSSGVTHFPKVPKFSRTKNCLALGPGLQEKDVGVNPGKCSRQRQLPSGSLSGTTEYYFRSQETTVLHRV